jgi:hypothetical protein
MGKSETTLRKLVDAAGVHCDETGQLVTTGKPQRLPLFSLPWNRSARSRSHEDVSSRASTSANYLVS